MILVWLWCQTATLLMPLSDLKYLLVMVRARPHHSSLLNSSCAGLLSARLRQTQATVLVFKSLPSPPQAQALAPLGEVEVLHGDGGPVTHEVPHQLVGAPQVQAGLGPLPPLPHHRQPRQTSREPLGASDQCNANLYLYLCQKGRY